MKVDSVELFPSTLYPTIQMSFRDPTATNPFIAKAILGLDAEEIVPKFYGKSNNAGFGKYYDLSLEKKDIVLQLKLNPDYTANQTYSDLRDEVYRTISASRTGKVSLVFANDGVYTAYISGFITKVEAELAVQNPEINITINCEDPMIQGYELVYPDIDAIVHATPTIDDDVSTAPHGFKFAGTFLVNTPTFTIADSELHNWIFKISPVGGFLAGDQLHYSSEYKDKYLYMVRGATTTHLVDRLAPNSIWPILFPGLNSFLSDTTFEYSLFSYIPRFWGV